MLQSILLSLHVCSLEFQSSKLACCWRLLSGFLLAFSQNVRR